MAIKIGMLSSNYNNIISNPLAINALEPIIFAFTNREVQFVNPKNTLEKTLLDAFYRPRVPSYVRLQLADGKLGEVILNALLQFEIGIEGNLKDLSESLSTLNLIGLETTARRAALTHLVLRK